MKPFSLITRIAQLVRFYRPQRSNFYANSAFY